MIAVRRTLLLTSLLTSLLAPLGCGQSDGDASTGGQPGSGGAGAGGQSGTGGASGGCPASAGAALPRLHVEGALIKDPCGKTIVLRGVSVIDLGAITAWEAPNGFQNRVDEMLSLGLAGHVVRLPVYPRTVANGGFPYYSPVPYPVGPAAPDPTKLDYPVMDLTAEQYVAMGPQAGRGLPHRQGPLRHHRLPPNRQHHGRHGHRRQHVLVAGRAALQGSDERHLRGLQ